MRADAAERQHTGIHAATHQGTGDTQDRRGVLRRYFGVVGQQCDLLGLRQRRQDIPDDFDGRRWHLDLLARAVPAHDKDLHAILRTAPSQRFGAACAAGPVSGGKTVARHQVQTHGRSP